MVLLKMYLSAPGAADLNVNLERCRRFIVSIDRALRAQIWARKCLRPRDPRIVTPCQEYVLHDYYFAHMALFKLSRQSNYLEELNLHHEYDYGAAPCSLGCEN